MKQIYSFAGTENDCQVSEKLKSACEFKSVFDTFLAILKRNGIIFIYSDMFCFLDRNIPIVITPS